MAIISFFENMRWDKSHALEIGLFLFRVSDSFQVSTLIVAGILAALYGML